MKNKLYIRDIFNFIPDESLKIFLDFQGEKYCEDLGMQKASFLGHRKLIGYFMAKGAHNWEDCVLASSENFHEEIARFFCEKIGKIVDIKFIKIVDYYYHYRIYGVDAGILLAARKKDYSMFHYLHCNSYPRFFVDNSYVSYFIKAGNFRAVKYYWNAGRCRSWYYADAVHSGNIEMLKYVKYKGMYSAPQAVYESINCRNFEMLEYTLEDFNYPNQFINYASELGYKDVVEFLISKGATNFEKGLEAAKEAKRKNLIRFFEEKIAKRDVGMNEHENRKCTIL